MEPASVLEAMADANKRQDTSSANTEKPRKNTIEEKRRMRNNRKKIKRAKKNSLAKSLQNDLRKAHERCEKNEKDIILYKNMSSG